MDCEETGEIQAAFVNDVGQIKASFGTRQLVQALTMLSETISSYAEGTIVISKAQASRDPSAAVLRVDLVLTIS